MNRFLQQDYYLAKLSYKKNKTDEDRKKTFSEEKEVPKVTFQTDIH